MASSEEQDLDLEVESAEDQSIGNLVEQTRIFTPTDLGGEVHAFFSEHDSAEGVVIIDGQSPAGLVMRNDFYQKIGSLFGRDLFINRPIQLIMNPHPLVVDVSVDIATISIIAMNRGSEQLYDLVVITEQEKYLGVVSVKRFMIDLSKKQGVQINLLQKQKEILRLANEAEIRQRKQIEEKSDSIKNLMDNAGQGFLSFGQDLTVSEEYSLECVQIYRMQIGGKSFLELMAKHVTPEVIQIMSQVFESVFASEKSMREKVYISLLPKEFTIYDKIVNIEFKTIKHGGLKKMMLILTDITEKKKLEARMTQERNNVKMVAKALTKQGDVNLAIEEFRGFIQGEAKTFIDAASDPQAALAEIFRQVHTFKGDFAQLGLYNTAASLHVLEDKLAAMSARAEAVSREELAQMAAGWDAQALLQEDVNILTDILGKSFFEKDERFQVSAETVLDIEAQARSLPDSPERAGILASLRRLRLRPLTDIVAEYRDYLQTLAERLGKPIEPFHVTGDDVLVEKEAYQKFIKSLVHVFRNMIDHGIETPEERLAAGKRELGLIQCKIKQTGDEVTLAVSDDGRGIDAAKVLRVAQSKGLLSPEQGKDMPAEDVYGLLFMDSFSTKEEVSALSGRGVGLSAVKAEVQRLGGDIEVSSKPGQGSKFKFRLPLS
jgi:two-component system chemotaxis sensor kinase CheA